MQNKNVQGEQARILYEQSSILFIAIILLVLIVILYFWNTVEHTILLGWCLLVLVLTAARVKLVKTFNAKRTINIPRDWLNVFAFSSFLSGITWGVLLIRIVNPDQPDEILLISIILTGTVGGSLVALSSYLPAYFAFTVPALVPFAVHLLMQQNTAFILTGVMIIIFLTAMLGFSVLVNRNIIDSIHLRFTNVDLLASLKIQKELAEKANIDKSRFLAATSHDLRQPLHALDLYLGALQVQLGRTEHAELLDKASASSQSLSDLLNALMDISRLDSGEIQINKQHLNLVALLEPIISEYEQQAQEKNITISSKLDEVVINTDPILLNRMIRNLLVNAINHNKNCDINISTTLTDGLVRLDIKDTGKGIDQAELGHIFSEFYQLNNPERDRSKGLGLGLAIVKRLSVLLDISIEVASELQKGSCFSLILTINDGDVCPLELADRATEMDLTGIFVIVIDDEAVVRDALKSLLRNWGCEVLLADSQPSLMAELAIESYPKPDLVISDYRLRDEKTGIEAVRAVREYFKQQIPAVIVTGDSSKSIVEEITAEQCHLLLKPVNSGAMRNEIESLLK